MTLVNPSSMHSLQSSNECPWSRWMAMGMFDRLTAASISFFRYTGLAYWRAPLEIWSMTGAFSSSQASTMAWSNSMLFTLKSPTSYFPLISLTKTSLWEGRGGGGGGGGGGVGVGLGVVWC